MAGIITVPFHIGDFLSGTLHMDTLEKGAYIMLLLSHYQAGEIGIPEDDKKLSRIAGVSLKTWMRIKPTMQEKFYSVNGFWVNSKCIDVIRKVAQLSSKQRAKALKKHNRDDATAEPRQCQPKPKPLVLSKDNTPSSSEEILLALELYNQLAEKKGLPKAQKLTKARNGKINARLKDAGGIDGWKAALAKLEASPFCTGQNDRGWIADIDFLITESSFTKLMEGKYDERPRHTQQGSISPSKYELAKQAAFRGYQSVTGQES